MPTTYVKYSFFPFYSYHLPERIFLLYLYNLLTIEKVAGEIRAPTRTLKIGAFLAVGLVTILYILVTLAYVSQ
jgi:hypothetical protein